MNIARRTQLRHCDWCGAKRHQPLSQDIRSRICAGLVANSSRDADDHARYAQLYGSDERLDYRNRQLYDAVIDTTRNSPHDTFTQLSTALADTNSDSIAGTGA